MIRIAICDDEQKDIERLHAMADRIIRQLIALELIDGKEVYAIPIVFAIGCEMVPLLLEKL